MTTNEYASLSRPTLHQRTPVLEGGLASNIQPTLEWYESSFKASVPVLERPYKSTAQIKDAVIERISAYKQLVPSMPERNKSPTF
jgi:hypothetical protein